MQLSNVPTKLDSQVAELLQATEHLMFDCVTQTESCRIDELIRYHLESGGGRIRAKLALSAGLAIGLQTRTCIALAACSELIHNASLLHDDIQDQDTQRRGQDAAWVRFDINTAMCAGTLMLSSAYAAVARCETNTGMLVSHLHRRTSSLIHGQTRDLAGHELLTTVEAYVEMATFKSGSLFALPLELAFIAAQRIDLLPTVKAASESYAVAYQIADDIHDLEGDLYRGNSNIVCVFQQKGYTKKQAVEQSIDLLVKHVQLAKHHAKLLPAASGALLLQLSNTLEKAVGPELKISCEQI